jgi:hypothetical protein
MEDMPTLVGNTPPTLIYREIGTEIEGRGKTEAIALCSLFIAVMSSPSVESIPSDHYRESSIKQALIKIGTPFTRTILQHIREKASSQTNSWGGLDWVEAHRDISRAADRLDAMLARKELIELTFQTEAG